MEITIRSIFIFRARTRRNPIFSVIDIVTIRAKSYESSISPNDTIPLLSPPRVLRAIMNLLPELSPNHHMQVEVVGPFFLQIPRSLKTTRRALGMAHT